MGSQVHTDIVQPTLQASTKFVTLSPERIGLIDEKGECKRRDRQQLAPEGAKSIQMFLDARILLVYDKYEGSVDNVFDTAGPRFRKDGSLPPPPNPTTGWIKLKEDVYDATMSE